MAAFPPRNQHAGADVGAASMIRLQTAMFLNGRFIFRRRKRKGRRCAGLSIPANRQAQRLAASSTFSPAFCTSLPAPATVLQADSIAIENSDNIVRATKRFMSFS